MQQDRSVLERPKKGAMVGPEALQWRSGDTIGFVLAARAFSG